MLSLTEQQAKFRFVRAYQQLDSFDGILRWRVASLIPIEDLADSPRMRVWTLGLAPTSLLHVEEEELQQEWEYSKCKRWVGPPRPPPPPHLPAFRRTQPPVHRLSG